MKELQDIKAKYNNAIKEWADYREDHCFCEEGHVFAEICEAGDIEIKGEYLAYDQMCCFAGWIMDVHAALSLGKNKEEKS